MTELSLFNSLFNDLLGNTSSSLYTTANTPRVDIKEEDKAYILEMELPGRNENDVSIELDHDSLKIASKIEEKNVTEKKEDKKAPKYILKEDLLYQTMLTQNLSKLTSKMVFFL